MALAYKGLREWIEKVDELNELKIIHGAEKSKEIGVLTDYYQKTKDAPLVMFDQIPGYPAGYRVLVNTFSTFQRVGLTLGVPYSTVPDMQRHWQAKVKALRGIEPVEVDGGPVLENVMEGDEVDVTKFPAPRWHSHDGGDYIGTGCMVIMRDPEDDWVNVGTYRVMVHDRNKVGLYISPGKQGMQIMRKYFARKEPCPVVVICGGDPLLQVASRQEIPYGFSEFNWAGGIRGEPYEVIRGKYTGLPIPADAEIAIEGFVHEGERLPEGPFGEFTGYYASGERAEPFIRVSAVYHRNDPIIVGRPPSIPPFYDVNIDSFVKSSLVWDQLEKAGLRGITGVWGHLEGGVRMLWAVSIRQAYAGHARQVGHVAAQCQAGAYLGRYVIVVDEDIDVTNLSEVMWAVCTRSNPAEDIDFIHRAWSGPLDPLISPEDKKARRYFNSRAIIDACRPYEWKDEFPVVCRPEPEERKEVLTKWKEVVGIKLI